MKDSMKEQSTVDIKRGICCFKFAEMMLGLNMGVSVPFQGVLELLEVVAKNGGDPAMDFFVAVCVGHRIHEHGDTLQVAIDFAEWSGVPDLHIKARPATASDIISDCDINRELTKAIMVGTTTLPADVAAEVKAMAVVAKIPANFTDAQTIVTLHNIKTHGDSLEEAVKFATGDSVFAQAARDGRLN